MSVDQLDISGREESARISRFSAWEFAARFRQYGKLEQSEKRSEISTASSAPRTSASASVGSQGSSAAGGSQTTSAPTAPYAAESSSGATPSSAATASGTATTSRASSGSTASSAYAAVAASAALTAETASNSPISIDSSASTDDAPPLTHGTRDGRSNKRQTLRMSGEHVRSHDEFREIVEDVRTYLVESRAQTEEDQIEYGTALNRAVLGYAREREAFLAIIQDRLAARRVHHLRPLSAQYATMAEAVFAEVIGLNVLESVLKDKEQLEEVQVIGTRIFEVRDGQARRSAYRFGSVEDVERLQQNLVLFNRDAINVRKQWAEVSLPDGSRVTMTGFGYTREPTITIRFFPVRAVTLEGLVTLPYETLDDQAVQLLRAIIAARLNIVIIGATNSGKTHLLKALIAEMPDEQRIVTIEQRCELLIGKIFPEKNVVEFEAPDDDLAHNGEQAFRLALRQSPERIILAEIRDQEANLYVRACTRGHRGSITTAHVNTLEDVPDAIADMCMLDRRGMNPERLRRRIAQFVTQIGIELRLVNGKRKIVRISEISEEDGDVQVRDLLVYDVISDAWQRMNPISEAFAKHLKLQDMQLCEQLRQKGWIIN